MNYLPCPVHGLQEILRNGRMPLLACGHRVFVLPDNGGIIIADTTTEVDEV